MEDDQFDQDIAQMKLNNQSSGASIKLESGGQTNKDSVLNKSLEKLELGKFSSIP